MQTVSKFPDDPVAQFHAQRFEDRIIKHIQRIYLTILDKVADLPAKIAIISQHAMELRD